MGYLRDKPIIGKFLNWWFNRLARKASRIKKLGFWGIVFFVGVPLPGTGVWSGSVVAALLELPLAQTIAAVSCGMILAGSIVLLASLGVINLWFICT